jgi:hypothetical protein
MTRLERSVAVIVIGVGLAAISHGQSESDKNTIKGVVVWKEDSVTKPVAHPVKDAFAVAFNLDNKEVGHF